MSQKIMINTAKILVIDDESEITDIIQTFLCEQGFNVMTENDPYNAVELAKTFQPDILLLDIMMPGVDGYEICENLKRDPKFSSTPIIFLSGKGREDDMGRSFKSGGDMYIKKPFTCENLLEIINVVLLSTM